LAALRGTEVLLPRSYSRSEPKVLWLILQQLHSHEIEIDYPARIVSPPVHGWPDHFAVWDVSCRVIGNISLLMRTIMIYNCFMLRI
jgi:hypothetical protein